MNKSLHKIVNFVVFQAAWFITVFSAASGYPWAGVGFTLLWMVFHLPLTGDRRTAEWKLLCAAALTGYLVDSVLVLNGIIAFPEQAALGSPSTLWMVVLWVNLAATINYCMSWLRTRYLLAALFAAVAGPVAYGAGEKLGAILLTGTYSIGVIAVTWFIAMPLLLMYAEFFNALQDQKTGLLTNGAE